MLTKTKDVLMPAERTSSLQKKSREDRRPEYPDTTDKHLGRFMDVLLDVAQERIKNGDKTKH